VTQLVTPAKAGVQTYSWIPAFAGMTILIALSRSPCAQEYPTRAVRLVVASTPGGGTDISARLIAPKLSEYLGRQVVVENRPGATTMIGAEFVARSAPDGHTLLMGVSSLTINPYIQAKVPYDVVKDFVPISQVVVAPNLMLSHPSLPVRSVADLIAFAKARPGQLNFASGGAGSNQHLAIELFLAMTKLKIVHVPYKGQGPALLEAVAGHVHLMMSNILSALPHVKGGRIRALGVTSLKRATVVPEVPAIAETGVPGYEVVQWYGILGPAGVPREIIARIHSATVRALQEPVIQAHFVGEGGDVVGGTPEEFAAVIRADLQKWGRVVKQMGIKSEQR
jgi:tripartite-type tricarboxylate transporter receptor subunit TctC